MKRNFYQIGLGISVALLFMAGQALAQNSGIFSYTVPFAFHAGTVKMPAGQYIVKIPSSAKGLIHLESLDGTRHAILLTLPMAHGKYQAPSKLIFNQYGTTYFLSKVWDSLSESGQELMKSNAEKEYKQQALIPVTADVALSNR
jgi:hypothetical protein